MTFFDVAAILFAISFLSAMVTFWLTKKPSEMRDVAEIIKERAEDTAETVEKLDELKELAEAAKTSGQDTFDKVKKAREELNKLNAESAAEVERIRNLSKDKLEEEIKKRGFEIKDFE
jgi:hypothetical protein